MQYVLRIITNARILTAYLALIATVHLRTRLSNKKEKKKKTETQQNTFSTKWTIKIRTKVSL